MKEGVSLEPEPHCCAASVQNISVGYCDLDSLIQTPPDKLSFRIELLQVQSEGWLQLNYSISHLSSFLTYSLSFFLSFSHLTLFSIIPF